VSDPAPEQQDPGWRDADRTNNLDFILEVLDHSDGWKPLKATRRALYRALRPRPGARILDAGCGTGIDVATLAPRVQPGGSVHGIDRSERMVALARQRHGEVPGVSFSVGDVNAIPFSDARFDATFAMRTIQYLDDPLTALREMARVTKPGGRIAVVEGAMSVMDLPLPELADRIMGHAWGLRTHAFAAELYRLLREAGLERVRILPIATAEYEAYPYFIQYAREAVEGAAEAGVATADEASEWLRQVKARVASGDWFSADCFFIAVADSRLR
jgi:SAM-dependent methyltransferase